YKDALELFAKLYAEKLHPNYLRNIGRCYQNLGDPDKAITSFRDYLRKAKGISGEERAEVEGYIKEMEDLAARRKGEATAAPPPTTAPVAPPPPATPPPPAAAPVLVAAPPASSPGNDAAPVYTRWWFWTIVGGVVLTGAGLAAAGVFTSHKDAGCDLGRT